MAVTVALSNAMVGSFMVPGKDLSARDIGREHGLPPASVLEVLGGERRALGLDTVLPELLNRSGGGGQFGCLPGQRV